MPRKVEAVKKALNWDLFSSDGMCSSFEQSSIFSDVEDSSSRELERDLAPPAWDDKKMVALKCNSA